MTTLPPQLPDPENLEDAPKSTGPNPKDRLNWKELSLTGLTLMAICIGDYYLIESLNDNGVATSLSFLFVLPFVISAIICLISDPFGRAKIMHYIYTPMIMVGIAALISYFFLKEGIICIAMLSPLWLGAGMIGGLATRSLRKLYGANRFGSFSLLLLPFIALWAEPLFPAVEQTRTVSRSLVVKANPEQIWPLLKGVPDVHENEGRWNLTQDILGVPRPLGARLDHDGLGAARQARWAQDIRFSEVVTTWSPNRAIGWRFEFNGNKSWSKVDRHLSPDGTVLRIQTGGYRIEPLADGQSRVTLYTQYRMKTPLNDYASAWGEVFLGDMENNLLWLIKGRAEAKRPNPDSSLDLGT